MTLLGIKINPLVYFVIMGLMGLTIMFVQEKREKESWNNRDFEGIIISKKVTDEHALEQFTIKTNDETVIVLDRFWKMTGYKVGDYVTKIKGDHRVTVRAVREVK